MYSSKQTIHLKQKHAATCLFMLGCSIALILLLGLAVSLLIKVEPDHQPIATLSPPLLSLSSQSPFVTPLNTKVLINFTSVTPLPTTILHEPTDISHSILGLIDKWVPPPKGKIVLTCTPEYYNQLCLMNANGSSYTRLTNHMSNDYYPSLTRNGEEIYFVSNRSSLFEVYTISLDGDYLRQLTSDNGNVSAPELSPDGNQVVFASKNDGDTSIWLMNSDGSNPYPINDEQWNEIDPTWSPDGQSVSFASMRGGYVELFTMRPNGTEIRQVTSGIHNIGGRNSWSPDGKKLIFYAGPQKDRDIYTVEINTGTIERLTQGGNNTGPCFSPDGEWIAFSSSRDGDHEIFIMRPDGSEVTQLTWNTYDDWQPRWGP